MQTTKLYIDGAFVAPQAGGSFEAINPATEAVFARIAAGTANDVNIAVRAARRAFDEGPWPQMPAAERAAVLRRIAQGITDRLKEIAAVETRDNGKPIPEAEWDVGDAAFVFNYYADLAETHEAEGAKFVDVGDEAFSSSISTESLGVVGAITPWNFPLLMAVWKVAPALAAGCTIVLKPSEFCSLSCAILAEIIDAAGLPAGVFNLVTGTGPEAGAPLADHPLVDKLAFTGSVATGRKVMTAAAAGIRTVSLELGGKSPFIIFEATSARLVTGGGRPAGLNTGYYIAPTIFADVPTDAGIWREEIFGPVVCVNPFDTEEEALALANDSAYGLAGAVMSDDLDRCERVAGKLRAGIIWINCSQPTFTQVPWGGYKSSGIGRELGTAGFMGFREIKQITRYDHTRTWGWYLKP